MSQASVLLKEAEVSMETGDYDQAIEKLQAAKAEAEPTRELFSQLAQACALRGRYLTVLSVYLEWAQCALNRDQLTQAEEAVDYALALRPDSPEAHLMRVKISRAVGRKDQLLEQLLELSYLYLEKGQGEESVPLMQEAVELCPDNLDLPLKLAEVYVSVGQIGLAETGYRRSVNLFLDAGESIKTVEPLRRLRMLKPDDTGVMLELGKTCLGLERLDEAEEQFRSILKVDLEHQEALLCLASVCESKGKFRNGILAVNKVLQLNPKSALGLHRMGDLQRASGDFTKATDAYRQSAQFYLEDGCKLEAAEAFQAILWMNEHDSAAQNGMHSLGIEPVPEEPVMPKAEKRSPIADAPTKPELEAPVVTDETIANEEEKIAPVQRFVRPRLVKKDEYKTKQSSSKPTLDKSRGLRSKLELREGLGFKSDSSGEKPVLPYRQKREVVVETAVIAVDEPVAEVAPVLAELTPEMPDVTPPDELFPDSSETFEKESGQKSLEQVEPHENSESLELTPAFVEAKADTDDDLELQTDAYRELFKIGPDDAQPTAEIQESKVDESEAEVLSLFNWPDEEDQAWPDTGELFPPLEEENLAEIEEEIAETVAERSVSESWEIVEEPAKLVPEEELNFELDFDFGIDEEPEIAASGELNIFTTEVVEPEVKAEVEVESIPSSDPKRLFPSDEEPLDNIFDGFEDWDLEPVSESPIHVSEVSTASEWTKPLTDTQPEVKEESLEAVVDELECDSPEVISEPIEIPLPEEIESLEIAALDPPVEPSFEQLREAEIVKLVDDEEAQDLTDILAQTLPVELEPAEEVVAETEPEVEMLPEPVASIVTLEAPEDVAAEEDDVPEDAGDAIVYYREALSHAPADEEIIMRLADFCLQFGLIPEALEHYRNLQRVNPGSIEIGQRLIKAALWLEDYDTVGKTLLRVAQLQFSKGDLVGCQDHLGDLLSLEPEHKEARQLMVEVFMASEQEKLAAWHLSQMVERWASEGEWEAATQALMRLGQIAPSDTVKERLALLYQKQGQDGEALQLFRELRDRYEESSDLKRAEDVAYRILRSEASTSDDRKNLVTLLEKQDLLEEAAKEKLAWAAELRAEGALDEACSVLRQLNHAESLAAEQLLVEIYLEGGKLSLAEQHAESLAERFLEKKAYTQAISLFESWTKAEPMSAKARERLAQFYQLGGDLDGAKLEWLLVTESHESQGDFERAVRSLERALELDPEQWEWRLRLARLKWSNLANAEGALAELRVIFSRRPDWTEATELLVEVLSAQNKMSELGEVLTRLDGSELGGRLKAETMESLKEKLQTQTDDFDLQFAWGELCYGLGSLDLAIEQFQKLRRQPEYRLRSYRLLGHCFSKKKGFNMTELALSQFRKGLALPNESEVDLAEIRCEMARLLIGKGRMEEASEQLQLARPWLQNSREVDRLLAETKG